MAYHYQYFMIIQRKEKKNEQNQTPKSTKPPNKLFKLLSRCYIFFFDQQLRCCCYWSFLQGSEGWDLCYPWRGYSFLEKMVISKMRQSRNLQGSAASNKSWQNWGEGTWPSFMGLEHCGSWGVRANHLLIHKVRKLTRTRCFWIKLFFLRKMYTDL